MKNPKKIITKATAKKWVKKGIAVERGLISGGNRWPDEPHYMVVDRYDTQTTHHYRVS